MEKELVGHTCLNCEEKWEAELYEGKGGLFYVNDDEGFCPNGCEELPVVG